MSGKGRNAKSFYVRIFKRIRIFLFSRLNRELLIFLFFFFISASFWFMQTLNDTYDYEFAVSLRLKNVPDKVVITSNVPQTIRFTVRDKGTALLNYMFGQSFYPVVLDWKDYSSDAHTSKIVISQADLLKAIKGQLISSTKILSIKTDNIELIYTKGYSKKLPVRLQAKIVMARQYYLSQIIVEPDSVLVYAPKKLFDSLTTVYTSNVVLRAVADTTRAQIRLRPVHGAKFIPEVVKVQLNTDIYMEKKVEVPIKGINFPPHKSLKTFPAKVEVSFQTGLLQSKYISPKDFEVVVDYEELIKQGYVALHLRTKPNGVRNVRLNQGGVDFLIETD